MKCQKCGCNNANNTKFCKQCGAILNGTDTRNNISTKKEKKLCQL